MKGNARAVREGAMMIALTVILILLTWYMPLFSTVGVFVCGLPMAVYAARCGFKASIAAMLGVFVISSMVTGSIVSSVAMLIMSVLPSVVAGYFMGREKPFFMTLFAVCLAVCLGWLFELYVIDKLLMDGGAEKMLAEMVAQMKEMLSAVMSNLPSEEGAAVDIRKVIEETVKMLEATLRMYFPSLVIISSMLSGYVTVRLTGFILKRLKMKSTYVMPFSGLKAPRSMGSVAVIMYIVLMISGTDSIFGMALANTTLVVYSIIGFCGLSFIDFKLRRKMPSSVLRWVIYLAVFMLGGVFATLSAYALVIIGVFDSGRDYRRLGEQSDSLQ